MSQEVTYSLNGIDIQVNRPEPISVETEVLIYKRRMDPEEAVETLLNNEFVLIHDFYSSGLTLLSTLKQYVKSQEAERSFHGQRDFRKMYRELSQKILLRVSHNKLMVRKSPEIGWLKKLYPNADDFLLPFPQVQGLNSSWQWYEKGIKIPGLRDLIHPYYGTYFPTRFEHVILFESWLKTYKGGKAIAIDVGIGSGILSDMLLKYNFETIFGTDNNPNAIIGQLARQKQNHRKKNIKLFYGDLFAECIAPADLIVFNPPWLPAMQNVEGLDTAIYYHPDLFPKFFTEAKKHLKPDGHLVLLFSNLAQITNVTSDHPIENELATEKRFKKGMLQQKDVQQASKKTRRNQDWRSTEKVELWVLSHA